jgi:hypothetical protein
MEEAIKKPRRNVMNSIRRRLNSGAYNKTRNLKKNERAVRDKLRAYEKKGDLKGYMAKRYDDVLDLMGRLEEIKEVGAGALAPAPVAPEELGAGVLAVPKSAAPVVPEPEPEAKPKKFTIRKRVPANSIPLMKLKRARPANPYVAPEFNPPPANLPPMPVPYGEYNREGDFHVKGAAGPLDVEVPTEENIGRFGYGTKKVNKGPKTLKKTRSLKNENMQYMERVHKSFLPLPELYNPYTGVKYLPEEDPLPNIQSAHDMLDQILEKAKRKALALKRRETKQKTQAKAAV